MSGSDQAKSDEPNVTTDTIVGNSITKKYRRWLRPLFVVGVISTTLIAWNATVAVPAMRAMNNEVNASVYVYRRWFLSPSQIVFDVRSITPEVAMVDIDRMLFNTAEALKDRHFDAVILAARGQSRLILDGSHFKLIGVERSYQNPMHVIATLQEHVSNLDGQPAFGIWTGGWLGVMGKQMEEHNELHMRWWVRPMTGQAEPTELRSHDYTEAP